MISNIKKIVKFQTQTTKFFQITTIKLIIDTMADSQTETKVKYIVIVDIPGNLTKQILTIEAAENNLRINKDLKDQINTKNNPDNFNYFARKTVIDDGEEYDNTHLLIKPIFFVEFYDFSIDYFSKKDYRRRIN